jgi:hypothetical protein
MKNTGMRLNVLLLSVVAVALGGCASETKIGGERNPVGGAAGGSSTVNASSKLEHCDHSLGTLAVEEDTTQSWYAILTTQYQLPATTPLLRLMIQQSNCFVIVDRGRGMNQMQKERDLAASGELRSRSNMGKGQMVAADYVATPNIQFAQNTGGGGAGAIVGHFNPLLGAIAGSMKKVEASTTLMLTDTRSGVQIAAAQGSASNVDWGFGALGVGGGGGAVVGAYGNTPQGKVIAGAFMDSYNQMVRAVRNYTPQTVAGGLGSGGQLAVAGATKATPAISLTQAQKKLAELGLYSGRADGIPGPGTSTALRNFQKIRGLDASGELDADTASALQR